MTTLANLTDKQKRAIWDVLVEHCSAQEQWWRDFRHHFPQCREYRFQGSLGFGGKVWATHPGVDVTCYPEDRTPERDAQIERANAALAALALVDSAKRRWA